MKYVFLAVVTLGTLDVVNIFRPSAAGTALNAKDPKAKVLSTGDHDEWSAVNHGVKISYCTSCAMKGAFMQVKKYVETEFPGVPIIGETYPIAPHKDLMKKVVTGLQIGTASMVFAGEQILHGLGVRDPQAVAMVSKLKEKKFPVLAASWVVGNMIQNGLSSTGAFEVFSAGEKIFSKLESGRLPGLEELYDNLGRTLQPASNQ